MNDGGSGWLEFSDKSELSLINAAKAAILGDCNRLWGDKDFCRVSFNLVIS